MRFTKLRWKNLFSYGNEDNELNLEQEGITFIRGVNRDNDTSNGSGKCVDKFTIVTIKKDGLISDITVGEIVDTYESIKPVDVLTRNGFKPILAAAQTAYEKPLLVRIGNKELICSRKHKLYGKHGWDSVENFFEQEVETIDGFEKLELVSELYERPLYDLQVEGEEYLANGIVSHNSSIIDVFVWALYGKPLKNMPIDDVLNTHVNRNGYASVEFFHNDNHYEINRYRADKTYVNGVIVKKNGVADDTFTNGTNRDIQKRIDDLLGLNYTSFVSSTIFSSEIDFEFPTTTPEKRRNHLESILGLQAYSEYGKLAKAKVKAIKAVIEEMIVKERELSAVIQSLKSSIESHRNQAETFDKDVVDTCEDFTNQVKELDVKLKSLQSIQNNRASLEQQLEKLEEKIVQTRNVIEKYIGNISELKSKRTLLESNLSHKENRYVENKDQEEGQYQKAVKVLNGKIKLMDKECPTCSRGWDLAEVEKLVAEYNLEKDNLKQELDRNVKVLEDNFLQESNSLAEQLKNLEYDLSIVEENKSLMDIGLESYLNSEKELKDQIKAIPTKDLLDSLYEKRKDLLDQYENKKNQSNPYLEFITQAETSIKEKNKDTTLLLKNKAKEEEELRYATFWDESFNNDGLKLFVFESIVPIINNRLSFYLPILFEGNRVQISFDKMMNMTIFSGDKLISYGGLSQGERKRVDIALALTLLDTAQVQHGTISNVMFFDELMDSSLDSQGVRAAIDVLRTLPIPTIFIMSHRLEISNEFDNILDVEKKGMFSRILT